MMAKGRYARSKTRRSELETALVDRIRDAEVLLESGRAAASITMGFYALEIASKIAICRRLELDKLPVEFQIHDLEDLLLLSGLSERIKLPGFEKRRVDWDYLRNNYSASKINDLRCGGGNFTSKQATNLLERLTDPTLGFIQWPSTTA